jgi:hypothetical protein
LHPTKGRKFPTKGRFAITDRKVTPLYCYFVENRSVTTLETHPDIAGEGAVSHCARDATKRIAVDVDVRRTPVWMVQNVV